jgi:uncharacterized protein YbjQ (UPF0145 family)
LPAAKRFRRADGGITSVYSICLYLTAAQVYESPLRRSEMIDAKMVTTALDLPGYRVMRNLGVVRGIVVRSRSIVGNIGATLQTLLGGNITIYTELCEKARADAHRLMVEHASELGANGIIGVRYDANEIAPGVTEVLAYGTAVNIEYQRR